MYLLQNSKPLSGLDVSRKKVNCLEKSRKARLKANNYKYKTSLHGNEDKHYISLLSDKWLMIDLAFTKLLVFKTFSFKMFHLHFTDNLSRETRICEDI